MPQKERDVSEDVWRVKTNLGLNVGRETQRRPRDWAWVLFSKSSLSKSKYSVLVELNSALGINNRFCGGDKSTSGIFSQSVEQLVFIYCKNAIKY